MRVGYGRTFDVGTFGSIFGHSVTQNLPVLGTQSLNPSNSWQSVFNLAVGPPLLDPATVLDSQPVGPDGNHLYPNGVRAWVYPQKMRLPTVDAWNATIQRQLTRTISVETGYVGNKGSHATLDTGPSYDENAPTVVGFADGVSTDQRRPYFAKFGWTSPLNYFGNNTDNHYNSIQSKIEKRFSGGTQLLANYTYSHAKGHDGPYFDIDRSLWYGRPDWQRNSVFVVSGIAELPFGRGKHFLANSPRLLDLVVGGWQVSSNTSWMGSLGFNTSYAECGSDNDVGSCHPDRLGNSSVAHRSRAAWYKVSDPLLNNGQTSGPWRRPQIGTFGQDVRNSLTGPRWTQTDASFIKAFSVIPEKLNAQFRADAFNLFNHVNAGNPGGCVDCSNAGVIQNQAPNAAMRNLEFGVRLEF